MKAAAGAGVLSAARMRGPFRSLAGAMLIALALTACSSGGRTSGSDRGPARASSEPVRVDQIPGSPAENVMSALTNPAAKNLPKPLVDVRRLVSGGPPPDGIPSINEPKFDRAGDVDYLASREPVLALEIGGEARAYPVQVLIWHEIAIDTVGGVPVVVSYCPLCNSALAFDRRAAGRVLTFGVSGRLYNSDLVMFDRQTRSLWPQLEGRAVAGVLTGTRLRAYPVQTVPWGEWRDAHPDGLVLNRNTGHDRAYGQNPYTSYDRPGTKPFLLDVDPDGRLPAKARVVGLGEGRDAVAVTTDRLLRDGTLELSVRGSPVVLFAEPGQASALDKATIAAGRDVGVTGAFSPLLGGRHLTFVRSNGGFVDKQTGTTWSVLGRGERGPLTGSQLRPVTFVDTFWFAWALFQPATHIVR